MSKFRFRWGGDINRHTLFEQIISLENLFLAWREFKKSKTNKVDMQRFEFNLEDNLFDLSSELKSKYYRHSHYTSFNVCDPKLRRIHKASVRDRVLHHAIFRIIYPIFDKNFIFDSYSCRTDKGTHRAVNRLEKFLLKLSCNNRNLIFALKCDIRKFFASIDQDILLWLVKKKIADENAVWLIEKIIRSFSQGLPLGNVTSQIFANIYLNELDQFIKHGLKVKYYLRYCDDFIILSQDKEYLENLILLFDNFLKKTLGLSIHPDKIIIRKYNQGIDFLGYVVLPYHRALRTKSRRRIFKKIKINKEKLEKGLIDDMAFNQSLQSYYGMLKHCHGRKLKIEVDKIVNN